MLTLEERLKEARRNGQLEHVFRIEPEAGPGGELLVTMAAADPAGDLAKFMVLGDTLCVIWACSMGEAIWPALCGKVN